MHVLYGYMWTYTRTHLIFNAIVCTWSNETKINVKLIHKQGDSLIKFTLYEILETVQWVCNYYFVSLPQRSMLYVYNKETVITFYKLVIHTWLNKTINNNVSFSLYLNKLCKDYNNNNYILFHLFHNTQSMNNYR